VQDEKKRKKEGEKGEKKKKRGVFMTVSVKMRRRERKIEFHVDHKSKGSFHMQ
jgi:hypothetical protein